jgi:PAS domain S-box-containing protein
VRRLLDAAAEQRASAETALRSSEQEARLTYERFEKIFLSAPEAMSISDIESGRLILVNDAFCKTFGYAREELIGHTSFELGLWSNPQRRTEITAALREGRSVCDLDGQARRHTGELRDVVYSAEAISLDGELRLLLMFRDITERKQAEQALRESEVRIRNVYEQANDGIYIISADNRYLDANSRGLELLGYTLEELVRMNVADVLAPEEVARLAVEPPRMMSGVPHLAEWKHVRKDGSSFPGEVSARRLDDHSYLAIVRDLSERRRAEAALRESEAKFRAIILASPVAMAVVDEKQNISFINPKFIATFGYNLDDIPDLAQWWLQAYPDPDYRRRVVDAWRAGVDRVQRDRSEREPVEYAVTCKDGTLRNIRFSMAPMGTSSLVICYDLTELRHLEEERNRLFNCSLDMLCVAGFDGYFKQTNPAWSNTLGWTLDELKSRPWLDFVHPEDREATLRAGEQLAQGQAMRGFENRYRCKDASYRWLSWNAYPMADTETIFAVVRDVTERKQAEDALRTSELSYRTLIENAADAIIVLTPDARICQVNLRACEMFGYSTNEFIGMPASAIVAPTDAAGQRGDVPTRGGR